MARTHRDSGATARPDDKSLHQLGLDHERLTFHFGGREVSLTDVHGRVAKELLA